MAYLLALDQGTTSSRAIVFDGSARAVSQAQQEFPQLYPQPGWVEHDPEVLWTSQIGVVSEALATAGLKASDIVAVGITNQRETTIVWDRSTGLPVSNAIVWQDRRTAPLCDRLRAEGLQGLIQAKTGLWIDPYFSGSKLRWILDNVAGVRARAERGELAFGTVDTWLAWKLTGGRLHLTDASNASRTMLFNIHSGAWDEELLRVFEIPPSLLPEVRASSEIYGDVSCPELGGASPPIGGIAGDQQAALFGQACFESGMAKNTYGTGCFLLMNTGAEPVASRKRLLTTVAWKYNGSYHYALEGSVFIGGAVVQWLRDGLHLIEKASDIETLARSVPDSGGLLLVPAFAGLGAPHWDAYARGTMMGITRGTTNAHVARAALESIAFQVADLLDAVQADAPTTLTELRVDGGASANDLLLQFQADLLGVHVVRSAHRETTALGAALLAGLAAGVFASPEAVAKGWQAERVFSPTISRDEAATLQSRWRRAVERSMAWEQQ